MNDLIIVIRSAGERTTSLCAEATSEIFPDAELHVINERPFSAAIKKGFELGIKSKAKWLLNIDADVIPNPEGLRELYEKGKQTDASVFQIQGIILDKLIPVLRPAGNHLYRLKHAKKAFRHIPDEGTSLRPETDMLNRMKNYGCPWKQVDSIVGIHDFEQFYEDIFRKAFLHAQKHHHVFDQISKYWNENEVHDPDFRIALAGHQKGLQHQGTVLVDKYFLLQEAKDTLEVLGLKEKEIDTLKTPNVHEITQKCNSDSSALITELQTELFPSDIRNRLHATTKNKLRHRLRRFIYNRV